MRKSTPAIDLRLVPLKLTLALLLAVTWLAAGCDDQSSADDDAIQVMDDADAAMLPEVPPDNECNTDADCPDGWFCVGPAGCDQPWACQSENPCSAVAPPLLCSCDGEAFVGNAGCPGRRHAGQLLTFAPAEGAELGEACNPLDLDAFRYDIVVEASGFDDMDGVTARIVIFDEDGQPGPLNSVLVEDGGFEAQFQDLHDPDEMAPEILVYFDEDEDGRCSDADLVLQPWNTDVNDQTYTVTAFLNGNGERKPAPCPG